MTSGTKPHLGEVVAFVRADDGRADDLLGAVVPARLREEPTGLGLVNVVPFVRPRSNDNAKLSAPAPVLLPADRPAQSQRVAHTMARGVLFVAISLLAHGAVLRGFWDDAPRPLVGTELEAITVELVPPGSNTPAGQATRPTENEGVERPGQVTETPSEQAVQQVETPTTDQSQDVPVAKQETAPEQPVVAEQPAPVEPQEPPREVVQQPEPRETVAMVETPQAEMPTEAPRPTPADPEKVTLAPPPTPQLTTPEPEKPIEKPKKPEQAKKQEQKPKAAERKRIAARTDERTQEHTTGPRAREGSQGVGRGGASEANYRGQVSAHLQRHKQYPSDARARGEQGTPTVAFSVDGGGRVTSVRLGRSSGYPSLDQEVQAMVRRASPFPAPPDGRSQSFSVPIGFGLR